MTEHELIWEIQFAKDGGAALHDLWRYLDRAPLFDVLGCAGEITWQGDTPDAFRDGVQFQLDRLNSFLDGIGTAGQHLPGRIADLQRQLANLRAARLVVDANEAV